MSDSYDKNPQRRAYSVYGRLPCSTGSLMPPALAVDQDASTVRDPIGSQHGAIENMNEQFFRSPPDNLGLGREQDRASDLVGARGTEVSLGIPLGRFTPRLRGKGPPSRAQQSCIRSS